MALKVEEFTIECPCGGKMHWKGPMIRASSAREDFWEIHQSCTAPHTKAHPDLGNLEKSTEKENADLPAVRVSDLRPK